jgi:hypothetical protein
MDAGQEVEGRVFLELRLPMTTQTGNPRNSKCLNIASRPRMDTFPRSVPLPSTSHMSP